MKLICTSLRSVSAVALYMLLSLSVTAAGVSHAGTLGQQDTVKLSLEDSLKIASKLNSPYANLGSYDTVRIDQVDKLPLISLQQMLKGKSNSLYVQESNGEPGVEQLMYLRGLSFPILNASTGDDLQPQVYINGVPVTTVNPFVYDVQQFKSTKIGPATNVFAGININNIERIEVIKDPLNLAKLGPYASNGAIWIKTKGAKAGRNDITVNAYTGIGAKPAIIPTNAYYENLFRQQFYDKYADLDQRLKYPSFLADSTNTHYYGPSDWSDRYYHAAPLYNVDFGLSGGSERANFRFFGGHTRNSNPADATNLKAYNASFAINMAPFTWWTVSGMINGKLTDRGRNKNMRDRLEEMRYLPDLSVPIPPNGAVYQNLLDEYKKSIDDNLSTVIQGDILFTLNHAGYFLNSRLSYDYSEGRRDLFYPSTMLEGNNYASRYFGYSERVYFNNFLKRNFELSHNSALDVEVGQTLSFDVYKYNYSYGYRGPSDFIKVFVVSGKTSDANYLKPISGEIYRNTDKERIRIASYYSHIGYTLEALKVDALLRYDGASNIQPDSRWIFSPAFKAGYTFIDQGDQLFNHLKLSASWSQFGKSLLDDRFSRGPQYRVDIGWDNEVNIPSFNGFAVISRPYSQGWVGYDVKWPITRQADVTLSTALGQDRVQLDLSIFQKDDIDQILSVPIASEFGYVGAYANGLNVRNRGVELGLGARVLKDTKLGWNTHLNLNHTVNKLTALPKGNDQLILGDRVLKVGDRIDNFWILEGSGAYEYLSEVPLMDGQRLTADGIALGVGDPKWIDQNNDGRIDQKDRVLKGQRMPKLFGSFNNNFSYKNFSLNVDLYFALGHSALNQRSANVYDFINLENRNDINSVREIFFWQQDVDISRYPVYNPWSGTNPYRLQQDFFLERLDYMKLRSLTLAYNFPVGHATDGIFNKFTRVTVYATGNNLYTWTKFSGTDPELITSMSNYSGYALPMVKSFTLGFQLGL
ncbi:TonB-dependent receptor plug domain-containing protein [Sphingobacterium sp. SGG-5]|uniref:TonB-dependent receptor plug domain-containing protein n=1 Tax=Sphingobacterium sp. SGG-5 TaxID=2710881 RepID=UPI0013EA6BD4|nr:TonB-dependent receptor plug domain-containing protein [Sphingobacterium sp. SGG-5]NGM62506.1 TonB-dependent receptor plug domain-containing protein [Sphingobacterium sp. SGG-5]